MLSSDEDGIEVIDQANITRHRAGEMARVRPHVPCSVYASQGGRLNRARTAGASASRTAHEMAGARPYKVVLVESTKYVR